MKSLKKIELKTTKMFVVDNDGKSIESDFEYKGVLLQALNEQPIDEQSGRPKGFGPIEMRTRLKIIKLVEDNTDNTLLLENSEYIELNNCVKNQKWQIVNSTIMNFIDDINNSEYVEVKEK